ncbi:MAG: heparinase II/III family protein, partial [Armatimonadetes bacterium]|nr:heparinase II/III family protein [Armatimonadota bacterium]
KIESHLLRPSVETIKRYRAGKSNWQSWHNAGMMAVALCLKDEKLLDEVLNDPECGYFFQMKNSILSDGAWWEGSWSYQFYSLDALLKTAEMAHRSGINLYGAELKKCLESPLLVTMPNGRTPPVHDAEESGISASLYEIAAARYDDAAFQDVIADGHGHRDKLAVNYYTNGQNFAPDLGRGWPYNLPIHREWYKLTLSHNTVTVDEEPQAECEGTIESSKLDGDYQSGTARADTCYEGVRMKRTVVLGKEWLLDVFEVESDAEHTYDWIWHGRGYFASALPTEPYELKVSQVSYKYLSSVRRGDGSSDWKAEWTLPGGKVYGLFKGVPGRTALLCDAPDKPSTNTLHSVILRGKAKTARFVALFSTKPMTWSDLPKGVLE